MSVLESLKSAEVQLSAIAVYLYCIYLIGIKIEIESLKSVLNATELHFLKCVDYRRKIVTVLS